MNTTCAVDPVPAKPATVLVVEDEILIRSAIAEALREEGLCVIEATNADEALSVLRTAAAVDLVLTDVKMPGQMDGLDLAEQIKVNWPVIRVLIASAKGPERDIAAFSEGFFLKPYDFTAVADRVRGLLASSGDDVRD